METYSEKGLSKTYYDTSGRGGHCSELMYSVIFNYPQYWTNSWTKVLYRGNSVPKI